MIDAAERLAVERGIGAMSLREVQTASGQRNKSAAQYHFGSREGLIDALVAARMGPINEHRRALLDELDEHASAPTVRDLVEILVEPLAEVTLRSGSYWARFLFQGFSDPAVSEAVRRSFEGRVYWEVRDRVDALLPHVPGPLRAHRLDQAVSLLVTTLAVAEAGRVNLPAAAVAANVVDTCVALLEAPVSESTSAELAARRTRRA